MPMCRRPPTSPSMVSVMCAVQAWVGHGVDLVIIMEQDKWQSFASYAYVASLSIVLSWHGRPLKTRSPSELPSTSTRWTDSAHHFLQT